MTTALTGQTRARLDCKETGESLVLYEPFTALSVPLPHSAPRFDVHVRVSLASNRNWPVDVRVSLADAKDEGEAKAAAASFRGRARSRGRMGRRRASRPSLGDEPDLCLRRRRRLRRARRGRVAAHRRAAGAQCRETGAAAERIT